MDLLHDKDEYVSPIMRCAVAVVDLAVKSFLSLDHAVRNKPKVRQALHTKLLFIFPKHWAKCAFQQASVLKRVNHAVFSKQILQ